MNPIESLFSLRGKVAVITGGGGGIGRDTAAMLAQAGARIALIDVNLEAAAAAQRALEAAGADALAIGCDITTPSEVESAFQKVMEAYGAVDVLVNNAALVRRIPAVETTLDVWRQVMDVNLNAAFQCSCEAAKVMKPGSAIVNLASIMGVSGGGSYPIASYHASKGGLINLTRALAVEWAERGIRVNAVAPTWVRTEFTKALLDNETVSSGLLDLMPLRKFADTADVAAAVLYLASSASKMVTGHVLAVDGGYLAK